MIYEWFMNRSNFTQIMVLTGRLHIAPDDHPQGPRVSLEVGFRVVFDETIGGAKRPAADRDADSKEAEERRQLRPDWEIQSLAL